MSASTSTTTSFRCRPSRCRIPPRRRRPPRSPRPRAPPSASAPAAPLTTREVIERARAAARAASDRDGRRPRPRRQARRRRRAAGAGVRPLAQAPAGPTGALMVASVLAAVGLSAGGYVFFEGKADRQAAQAGGGRPLGRAGRRGEQPRRRTGAGRHGACRRSPTLAVAPAGPDLSGPYSAAVAKIDAPTRPAASPTCKKLADGGYAPAEFYLAAALSGRQGRARQGPEPVAQLAGDGAAEGGDRTAMHNLALDEHEGVGGAAQRRPARPSGSAAPPSSACVDSQFNLAAIYEHGDGVSQNPAEAYKWYLIAGRAGDAESRGRGAAGARRADPRRPRRGRARRGRVPAGDRQSAATMPRRRRRRRGRRLARSGHRPARAEPARLLPGPHRRRRLAGAAHGARRLPARPGACRPAAPPTPPRSAKLSVYTR